MRALTSILVLAVLAFSAVYTAPIEDNDLEDNDFEASIEELLSTQEYAEIERGVYELLHQVVTEEQNNAELESTVFNLELLV